MLKRSVLGLVLAGLLAVPAGIALADDASEDVTSTTVDEVDRDQTRDQERLRIQDPSVCDGYGQSDDVESGVLGDQLADREQVRARLHDGENCGAPCEGAQEQAQTREQEHMQLQDLNRVGERQQHGPGARGGGLGYGYGLDG
jgi:hypothetical protein